MLRTRRPLAGLLIATATLALAGCTSLELDPANLPAGTELIATAGTALRSVTSAHLTFTVHGALPGVPMRSAQIDLDSHGTAKGSVKIADAGAASEIDFVAVKGAYYVRRQAGGYQRVASAAAINLFDPAVVLNPNIGLAKVTDNLENPTTTAKETVDGVQCYKLTGTITVNIVSALVPGIRSNVDATVWLAQDGAHLPVREEFTVPGKQPATVDMDISNVDASISVTAPNTAAAG
ncbi:MAG TPA: LppX_LprAFG lipoprotein [Pseudonocardiaceae bacterium]|nr:LppX_LprAFG lipoprotein [Pseudonocardiaceae bacterium]